VVLLLPACLALAGRRQGPYRKPSVTYPPLPASHARIAPVAIDERRFVRVAQEKSRLGVCPGRLSSSLRAVIGFPACTA